MRLSQALQTRISSFEARCTAFDGQVLVEYDTLLRSFAAPEELFAHVSPDVLKIVDEYRIGKLDRSASTCLQTLKRHLNVTTRTLDVAFGATAWNTTRFLRSLSTISCLPDVTWHEILREISVERNKRLKRSKSGGGGKETKPLDIQRARETLQARISGTSPQRSRRSQTLEERSSDGRESDSVLVSSPERLRHQHLDVAQGTPDDPYQRISPAPSVPLSPEGRQQVSSPRRARRQQLGETDDLSPYRHDTSPLSSVPSSPEHRQQLSSPDQARRREPSLARGTSDDLSRFSPARSVASPLEDHPQVIRESSPNRSTNLRTSPQFMPENLTMSESEDTGHQSPSLGTTGGGVDIETMADPSPRRRLLQNLSVIGVHLPGLSDLPLAIKVALDPKYAPPGSDDRRKPQAVCWRLAVQLLAGEDCADLDIKDYLPQNPFDTEPTATVEEQHTTASSWWRARCFLMRSQLETQKDQADDLLSDIRIEFLEVQLCITLLSTLPPRAAAREQELKEQLNCFEQDLLQFTNMLAFATPSRFTGSSHVALNPVRDSIEDAICSTESRFKGAQHDLDDCEAATQMIRRAINTIRTLEIQLGTLRGVVEEKMALAVKDIEMLTRLEA